MAPSRKRRISEPVSGNDEGQGLSSPTPTPAKKKSKRQSMLEQRAAAAEWAKKEAAKKAAGKASTGTPKSVAASSPMTFASPKTTNSSSLTGPSGTPVSGVRKHAPSSVSKQSPIIYAGAGVASSGVNSTKSPETNPKSSGKKKRKSDIALQREKARLWNEQQLLKKEQKAKGSLDHAQHTVQAESRVTPKAAKSALVQAEPRITPKPANPSVVQATPRVAPRAANSAATPTPLTSVTSHTKVTAVSEDVSPMRTQQVGQASRESMPEGEATMTTTTNVSFVEERFETIPIPVQKNIETICEDKAQESDNVAASTIVQEAERIMMGSTSDTADLELVDETLESESRVSFFSALLGGLKIFVKCLFRLIFLSLIGILCHWLYYDVGVNISKHWNVEVEFLPSAPKDSPTHVRPIYCYENDAATAAFLKRSDESLSPTSSPYAECKKTAQYDLSGLPRKPCPKHGICCDGAFHRCAPEHLFMKAVGQRKGKTFGVKPEPYCALTPLGKQIKKGVDDIVEEWTSNCSCGNIPCPSAIAGERNPTFWLEDVVNELEERGIDAPKARENSMAMEDPLSLRKHIHLLLEHFGKTEVPQDAKGEGLKKLVSLSKEARSKLSIPWGCWFKLWSMYFLNLSFAAAGYLVQLCIQLTVKYPISVAVLSLTSWQTWKWSKGRRLKNLICSQADDAEAIAYKNLKYEAEHGKNEGYVILHLREDVAQEMFPNSLKQRKAFSKDVWPRVARVMKADVRIQTIKRKIGVTTMDCWIWHGNAASTTPTPKRS